MILAAGWLRHLNVLPQPCKARRNDISSFATFSLLLHKLFPLSIVKIKCIENSSRPRVSCLYYRTSVLVLVLLDPLQSLKRKDRCHCVQSIRVTYVWHFEQVNNEIFKSYGAMSADAIERNFSGLQLAALQQALMILTLLQ